MIWLRRIAAGLLLLASAAVQAQTDTTTAEQLLRHSGLWDQLGTLTRSYPDDVVAEVAQSSPGTSETEQTRLRRLMARAFAADRLQATALRVMSQGIQPQHAGTILDWYRTSAGQAIRQAEVVAAEEQSRLPMDQVKQAGHQVLSRLPGPRRQLIDDIVTATRAAEAMLQITEGSLLAMQRGLALAVPDRPALSEQQIGRMLRSQRKAMLDSFTDFARASSALAYHGVSDNDLRAYVDFCNSPQGSHFFQVGVLAFEQAISAAMQDMMQGLPGTRDQQNL